MLTICALFGVSSAGPIYNSDLSDIVIFTKMNFDKQVTSKRDKGISIVHFYKNNGK